MMTRREFFSRAGMTAGGMSLAPWVRAELGMPVGGKPPMRFVFMHKGNGLFPEVMVPPSLTGEDAAKEKAKQAFSVELSGHELPEWMRPVAAHKEIGRAHV